MTEPGSPVEAQLARIAALKARRDAGTGAATPSHNLAEPPVSGTAERPAQQRSRTNKKRGHAALGGRIAVAGIGASGLLGIVTVIGVANAAEQVDTEAPEPEPAQQALLTYDQVAGVAEQLVPAAAPQRALSVIPTPIYLTANPIVRTITVQPPPVIITIVDPAPLQQTVGAPAAPAPGQAVQSAPSPSATQPDLAQPPVDLYGPQTSQQNLPQAQPVAPPPAGPAPVVVAPAAPPTAVPAPPAAATAPPAAPVPAPPKSSGSG